MNSADAKSRVLVQYPRLSGEGLEQYEPPFVIGVLADLSNGNAPQFCKSRFLEINRDNFEVQLKKYLPNWDSSGTSEESLPMPWLTLQRLVLNVETGYQLKVFVLDLSMDELRADLASSTDICDSELHRIIIDSEYGTPEGMPFGLLLADFEFAPDQDDLQVLTALAEIASKSATPLVASPSARFFGLQSFDDVASFKTLKFEPSEVWLQFRKHPFAKFVTLAMPRFELTRNVLAPASWLFVEMVARAIARSGWPARLNFPLNETGSPSVTMEWAPAASQLKLFADNGLMLIAYWEESGDYRGYASTACDIMTNEVLSATLFVRAVSLILRDHIGSFKDADEVERYIQDWLDSYVALPNTTDDTLRPLQSARVEIYPDDAGMRVEISLQPSYQFTSHVAHEMIFHVHQVTV